MNTPPARPARAPILLAALALAGCPPPARPLDDAAVRDLLREQGLDEFYNGSAESGLMRTEWLWTLALRGDLGPAGSTYTYLRQGEPLWDDRGWTRLADGVDSALVAREWRALDTEPIGGEYLRAWEGGEQRLTLGRFTFGDDSTGYFVTAVLAGAPE